MRITHEAWPKSARAKLVVSVKTEDAAIFVDKKNDVPVMHINDKIMIDWLGFNGTFRTIRLHRALKIIV